GDQPSEPLAAGRLAVRAGTQERRRFHPDRSRGWSKRKKQSRERRSNDRRHGDGPFDRDLASARRVPRQPGHNGRHKGGRNESPQDSSAESDRQALRHELESYPRARRTDGRANSDLAAATGPARPQEGPDVGYSTQQHDAPRRG